MTLYKAKQLLQTTATLYKLEKESFSRTEIVKKINEIKYLSGQKKVPRLSLRKEVVHLENLLQGIFELERRVLSQKKKETTEASVLKRKLASMQKRLNVAEDKDLQHKIEKLSHLLGDYLAKKGAEKEILEMQAVVLGKNPAKVVGRVEMLQQRLEMLKDKLKSHPEQEIMLRGKIKFIEDSLAKYGIVSVSVEPLVVEENIPVEAAPIDATSLDVPSGEEVRHDVLFDSSFSAGELVDELPLPPPPRMTKK